MNQPECKIRRGAGYIVFLCFLTPALADQVVPDDQIVNGSLCVGITCADGEFNQDPVTGAVNFDTIKIKASDPQIYFFDTSTSGSFPTNDWLMGIADDIATGAAFFYISDLNSGNKVLQIQAAEAGGVALGAGSAIVSDAISVGSPGAERPIVNVAPGVDDSDAVNVAQFNAFQQQTEADNAAAIASIESDIAATQTRIDDLHLRITDLVLRVNALSN